MDSLRRRTIPAKTLPNNTPAQPRWQHPETDTLPPRERSPRFKTTDTKKRTCSPKQSRTKRFHPLRWILITLVLSGLVWSGYFAWKTYHISRIVRISSQTSSSDTHTPETTTSTALSDIRSIAASLVTPGHKPLKGEEDGRINILLLGRAGVHHPGRDLTDTIMIASIDTRNDKIALLSLPRDLYVQIPDTHTFTKINAVYQQGLTQNKGAEIIEKSVETITGLPIHYFFSIDFDGFEKVIDALGGINVEVMRDIYDPRYPGPNYSYETFEIKKGWQTLDGKTALKYVRERHNDPEGDFGRAKRQQQVIQAVKNKAFSLKTFVDVFALDTLLDILGESVRTDIAPDEIESFIALSKKVDMRNITNVVVDAWKADSLLRVSHTMVGPTRMFILVPRVGNYGEIQDVTQNLFDLDTIRRRQEKIATEDASVAIINRSSNRTLPSRVQRLLKNDFGFDQVRIATDEPSDDVQDSTGSLQDDSFIIDRTSRNKPFSLDEILKKLPVTLHETADGLPDDIQEDFILILGDDLGKDLDFEEDSVEDFKQSENDNIAYPADMMP